jgi:hypothetical protein
MLRKVSRVTDLAFGKFEAYFGCGHRVVFDELHKPLSPPKFKWHCPFCRDWKGIVAGDLLEVTFIYQPEQKTIAEFASDSVKGKVLLVIDGEADWFCKWEVVRLKKI